MMLAMACAFLGAWSQEAPEAEKPAAEPLSRVRVACVYENLTDGVALGRSPEETVRLFKEMRADLVFRCFWRWRPIPDSPDSIAPELLDAYGAKGVSAKQIADVVRAGGHSYEHLKGWTAAIRKECPDLLLCGAIPAQRLNAIERNDITGRIYTRDETAKMALDPAKWGLTEVSKEKLQESVQQGLTGGGAYFPDITQPVVQELMLSWAKKQIDCGVDAIWIDLLYHQASFMVKIAKDPAHAAVKESCAGAARIVDGIHEYGRSVGKHIAVGTWAFPLADARKEALPKVDFLTLTPTAKEVFAGAPNEGKWTGEKARIEKAFGGIPVFVFIDWGGDNSPTATFGQRLAKQQQRDFLRALDATCAKAGMTFAYPAHGGHMGAGKLLSYGKYHAYDSLAPEFETYETIRELAQKRADRK